MLILHKNKTRRTKVNEENDKKNIGISNERRNVAFP